jgi:hypothetical protein
VVKVGSLLKAVIPSAARNLLGKEIPRCARNEEFDALIGENEKQSTQYPCAFSGKNGPKGAWILRSRCEL